MPAPYRALDIAKWILASVDRDAGDSITHLKLQKLVYYAQAWSLALRGKPLFDEELQAWAHGPVAESVFHEYRDFSWRAIPAPEEVPEIDADDAELVDEIVETYGEYSAKQLERMTHSEKPWMETRGDLPVEARSSRLIGKELMASFYRESYDQVDGEAH